MNVLERVVPKLDVTGHPEWRRRMQQGPTARVPGTLFLFWARITGP